MVGSGLLADPSGVYLRGVLCEREMEDKEVIDGLGNWGGGTEENRRKTGLESGAK